MVALVNVKYGLIPKPFAALLMRYVCVIDAPLVFAVPTDNGSDASTELLPLYELYKSTMPEGVIPTVIAGV